MKLKFWKKDDFSDYKLPPLSGGSDLGLGGAKEMGLSQGLGGEPGNPGGGTGLDLTGGFQPGTTPSFGQSQPFGGAPNQGFTPSPIAPGPSGFGMHDDDHGPAVASQGALHGKDLEVIAAKLDAIKSQLDMLNLRISTLEQRLPVANQDQGGPRKPWY